MPLMKVIQVDNFDRDTVDDVLITTNISEKMAKVIERTLNQHFSNVHSPYFYKAVPADYKLKKWEP